MAALVTKRWTFKIVQQAQGVRITAPSVRAFNVLCLFLGIGRISSSALYFYYRLIARYTLDYFVPVPWLYAQADLLVNLRAQPEQYPYLLCASAHFFSILLIYLVICLDSRSVYGKILSLLTFRNFHARTLLWGVSFGQP